MDFLTFVATYRGHFDRSLLLVASAGFDIAPARLFRACLIFSRLRTAGAVTLSAAATWPAQNCAGLNTVFLRQCDDRLTGSNSPRNLSPLSSALAPFEKAKVAAFRRAPVAIVGASPAIISDEVPLLRRRPSGRTTRRRAASRSPAMRSRRRPLLGRCQTCRRLRAASQAEGDAATSVERSMSALVEELSREQVPRTPRRLNCLARSAST